MAAVGCAARRLGGSLLQRTQAAVTEEGRRLAPSRLMRFRELSSDVPSEHAHNAQNKEEDCREVLKKTLETLEKLQKKSVFQQRMMSIERATKSVVYGAAKLIVLYAGIASAFKAVTQEN